MEELSTGEARTAKSADYGSDADDADDGGDGGNDEALERSTGPVIGQHERSTTPLKERVVLALTFGLLQGAL
jgi:hypothetical protein